MRNLPRVLCVDDEPRVLAVFARLLAPRFEVECLSDPSEALARVRQAAAPFAVIVSDLQMPAMNGIELLREVRQLNPGTVRVLLTGHADTTRAIDAVNDGAVFRFLTKPCAWDTFIDTVVAAAERYQAAESERVQLEQTLHGAVRALADVLTVASPPAFARATRLKRYVGPVATVLGLGNRWEIEVAALRSQLGRVTLPPELTEKLDTGAVLTAEDAALVAELPAVAAGFIQGIPRLDSVREMLRQLARPGPSSLMLPGARILRTAIALDTLVARGTALGDARRALEAQADPDDALVLAAFWSTLFGVAPAPQRSVRLRDVREGMVFMDDVKGPRGLVLASRGQEVGPAFLRRLRYVWTNALLDAEVRVVEHLVN